MMEDTLKKTMKTKFKKMKKGKTKVKRDHEDLSDDSNSSWSVGLGSKGGLGQLATVPNKIKRTNNNSYPTDPIKTIPLKVINSSKLEQKKTPHSMVTHVELQL